MTARRTGLSRGTESVAAFIVAALAVLPAGATTLAPLSTEHLVRRADVVAVVVIGRVTSISSATRIWTRAEATVTESIKGTTAGTILRILTPGGTSGRLGQLVEGAATFHEGETCVVFLTGHPSGTWQTIGMEQGKLAMEAAPGGGSIVRRSFTAERVEQGPDGRLRPAPALPETEPMDPYLDRLRRLAGGGR